MLKALVIDDDPDFNALIKIVLQQLNIEGETVSNEKQFFKRLKEIKPDLCLIDLNMGELKMGFTIIKAIRSVLGQKLPLFVVSSDSDAQSIAHAAEIGANDYLVKPINKNLLAEKIRKYVDLESNINKPIPLVPVPNKFKKAILNSKLQLIEMDEFGISIRGNFLLTKGSKMSVSGRTLAKIIDSTQQIEMRVVSTWIEASTANYGAYLEFDQEDEATTAKVRNWLTQRAEVDEEDADPNSLKNLRKAAQKKKKKKKAKK